MTIEVGETVFVDTNVLLCATDRSRGFHEECRRFIAAGVSSGYHLALSGQILREYLVVATRPVEGNGLGLSSADALRNAHTFGRAPTVFCDERESVSEGLRALATSYELKGKRLHDANVVATMLVAGIRRLITVNVDDFSVFTEIEVSLPPAAPAASR